MGFQGSLFSISDSKFLKVMCVEEGVGREPSREMRRSNEDKQEETTEAKHHDVTFYNVARRVIARHALMALD